MARQEKKIKLACFFFLFLFTVCASFLIYQIITSPENKTVVISSARDSSSVGRNEQEESRPYDIFLPSITEPVNILVLGRAGEGHAGGDLTDTIIMARIMPQEKKVFLVSLPRDFLVRLPQGQGFTKINSLYQLAGVEELEKKVEQITGLQADYYCLINIKAAQEVIGLVDGLNVYVPQDIYDPRFPGDNYAYQTFILRSGWRYLDGAAVLKYLRTRYTSPQGDFDRMARQQQIIHLLKQKILELNPLWDFPTYVKLFQRLEENITTDLSLNKTRSLWQISKEIKAKKIRHLVLDKKNTRLLSSGLFPLGQDMASVVYPKAGYEDYSSIKEHIQSFITK